MRLASSVLVAFTVILTPFSMGQMQAPDSLANNTVLIVRHAEKPAEGSGLTPAGVARAQQYVRYFEPFRENGMSLSIDALYAGADSEKSMRPRLTLEPLSRATGMKLDSSIGTKEPEALVKLLRTQPHGAHPLISWRHEQIPALVKAFGGSANLVPNGKWPDEVYDWVLVLTFDRAGKLQTQTLVHEHLSVQQ